VRVVSAGLIVIVPFAGLAVAVAMLWGHGIGLADMLLAVGLYTVTGFGATVGFHRLITHRSFTARPWLRIALAIAGSMSFQGDVITWAATHRRHNAFTDRPGDPHSPTGTAPVSAASSAAWSTPMSAGCSATIRPRPLPLTMSLTCSPTPR
jgi:stearoyl-CoA desaturase (Delta-9 desaturase)